MDTQVQGHQGHNHMHGPSCGHTGIRHEGHVDYLHEGHLHHAAPDGTVQEHNLAVNSTNPDSCTTNHSCTGHAQGHKHAANEERVRHGNHTDYLVGKHLHHPHGDHCDYHGEVDVV